MISQQRAPVEVTAGGLHHYLCQCHGSSCCACKGGTSVNVLPRSGIAVWTCGVVSLSCPDTGERLNSKCWVSGMPRSSKPPGQEGRKCRFYQASSVCFLVCVGRLSGSSRTHFQPERQPVNKEFMCSQVNETVKQQSSICSTLYNKTATSMHVKKRCCTDQ